MIFKKMWKALRLFHIKSHVFCPSDVTSLHLSWILPACLETVLHEPPAFPDEFNIA